MWWTEIAAGPGWGGCLLLLLALVLSWAVVITAVPALFRPHRPSAGTATQPGRAAPEQVRHRETALRRTSHDRDHQPS